MQDDTHLYLIGVSGDKFTSFEVTDELPEALVTLAQSGNSLAVDIIVRYLRRTRKRNLLFAQIPDDAETILEFTIQQANTRPTHREEDV